MNAADLQRETAAGAPLVLSLRGIGKTFSNGTEALKGLNLDIRQGEFLSLLGPSGCGKSTALRLMAGLVEPTEGEVAWAGAPARAEAGAHGIGFVFQEPTLMPWANVFDNVFLPFRLSGLARAQARDRVNEALALVGLEAFAHAYPRELSGGMKMRVSIARALVTRPKLLLMDEPFAALDEITRFKLNDELLSLWNRMGFTVAFITHSVFESVYLSSRIVVMTPRPGRVAEEVVIDASYPRDEEFRTSPDYAALTRRASRALRAAMGEAAR